MFTTASSSFWIPFTSPENAAAAQLAMDQVNAVVQSGFLAQVIWAGGSGVLPAPVAPAFLGGAVVTVTGGSNLGLLPAAYYALSNASTDVLAAIGGANTTVVSGNQSTLIYRNTSANGEIYLGGGLNYISEVFDTSAARINVDGGPSHILGSGAALIDAAHGSTTVNLFPNALVNIIGGGAIEVQGMAGTEVVGIAGTSSVPARISGGAGVNLIYTPDGGAAVINPGAGNLIVIDGTGGSETVFGGAAPSGVLGQTAALFTGSSTVFAGNGYFQGGSAGGNFLLTSSIPGAATLVGGGVGDFLQANAAGDVLMAGPGTATLFASAAEQGGVTFITGSGASTVIGAAGGLNTIEFGSGTSTVFGQHNVGGAGGLTGNRYFIDAAGGSHRIGDFLASFDVFDVTASFGAPSVLSLIFFANAGSSPFGQAGSRAVLSDGTTIDFVNAAVSQHGGTIS